MILDEQCESARILLPCICCGFLTADFGHFFSATPVDQEESETAEPKDPEMPEEAGKDTSAEAPPAAREPKSEL